MDLYQKIRELALLKGVSIAELERSLDFANGSLKKWGKQSPSSERLKLVADYFEVTTDYLLGRNNVPQWATKNDLIELDKLLNSESNMTFGGETLTDEEKQRVNDVLTAIFWDKVKQKI